MVHESGWQLIKCDDGADRDHRPNCHLRLAQRARLNPS